jgi:hypothetical protein
MTEAERRIEQNRAILERMHGAPEIGPGHPYYDPFTKFDPSNPNVPQDNDNEAKK